MQVMKHPDGDRAESQTTCRGRPTPDFPCPTFRMGFQCFKRSAARTRSATDDTPIFSMTRPR